MQSDKLNICFYRITISFILILLTGCASSYRIDKASMTQLQLMMKNGYLNKSTTIILPSDSVLQNSCNLPSRFIYSCLGGYAHIIKYSSPDLNFYWLFSGCSDFSVCIPKDGMRIALEVFDTPYKYDAFKIRKREYGKDLIYNPDTFNTIGFFQNKENINHFLFDIPKKVKSSGAEWTVYLQCVEDEDEPPLCLTFCQSDE